MDYTVQAIVHPRKNSQYEGQFENVQLTVFVRQEDEGKVVATYHRVLDQEGLVETQVLDAGVFRPEDMPDAALRATILEALSKHGFYAVISEAKPASDGSFSRN